MTLASELTEDSDERSSIRAISNIFNYVGMIMASSGTLVFVGFFAKDGNLADSGGWTKTAILFGACALVVYLIAATATKGYEQPVNPKERTEKFKLGTYFEVLKLKPFKYVLLYTVFGYGGMFIFTSGYIYYLLCNAGFTEAQASLVLLIYCIVNIVISMIFVKIGDKLEKKTYVIISALLLGVGMISAHCIGANTIVVYAVFILFALATATFFIHCYAMVYDICDLDYFVSGEDRSGIIVSVFVAVIKIVGGVGMYAVGWILTLAGYDALALVQTASSLNGISIGMMLVPGILVLIGAAIILKYPISKKNFAALSQAVKLKAEGKEYSVEEFKELL